jgi:hypothetical protein
MIDFSPEQLLSIRDFGLRCPSAERPVSLDEFVDLIETVLDALLDAAKFVIRHSGSDVVGMR